jgi:hypothetical protein
LQTFPGVRNLNSVAAFPPINLVDATAQSSDLSAGQAIIRKKRPAVFSLA